MLILAKFESGHSADAIIIDNVVSYICLGDGDYMVTYEDPKQNYDLFDIPKPKEKPQKTEEELINDLENYIKGV